jgi:hypothetical protein
MRLTWKDGVATVLVAATVALYGAYLAWGGIGPSWVGIQDVAGMGVERPGGLIQRFLMTAMALGLGLAAYAIVRRRFELGGIFQLISRPPAGARSRPPPPGA